ncbi:MAG: hypothetical protein JXA13_07265 [Anaerolineales bacterium]|nr:hypothetical protein [Anaerolineales bacterium]
MKYNLLMVIFLLLLNACTVSPESTPIPASPTETPQATATIEWFPATATPTRLLPRTNATAAPEWRPGLDEVTYSDEFDSSLVWDTAVSDQGSAIIDRNRLTLAVQPEVYLFSLNNQLLLTDFYAEITASASLCKPGDSYGLLFRASPVSSYRFSVGCDGTVWLDRISVKERNKLYEPVPSGDAPPGAPAEVRIGVWMVGPEMRFFLNGRYQFSYRETTLPSGTLGVFVSSEGDTPVTISFSNLVVRQVNFTEPQPTPTATPDG